MGTSSRALSSIQREVVDGLAGGGRMRYDALPDLIANKLTALLGRGDVKDLVDLYWLAHDGTDVLASLADARAKDGGLEPSTLAWVLRSVPLAPERLMLLRPVSAAELGHFRDGLIERLQAIAWPAEGQGSEP